MVQFTFKKLNNLTIVTLKKPDINDFAEERNKILAKASSEWVFFLDTDETITAELGNEIKKLDPTGYNGFYVKRKIIFLGKCVGEDKVLRLGRKGSGKWHRRVHEIWNLKGRVGTLNNYILHYTSANLYDYIEKINKYSDIHAIENRKESKHSSLFKIIFYPKLKFIVNVLSGRGFVFSLMQSFHSFLAWAKEWQLEQ